MVGLVESEGVGENGESMFGPEFGTGEDGLVGELIGDHQERRVAMAQLGLIIVDESERTGDVLTIVCFLYFYFLSDKLSLDIEDVPPSVLVLQYFVLFVKLDAGRVLYIRVLS